MQITSLYIENFGVLHEYRLEPHAGLFVLCENNGFGKTTLAAFIKAMLYGLPNTRKSDLDENERKKYQPWQGGAFGGTMTFRAGGKEYRAERFFAVSGSRTKNDTFVLYDLSDNRVTDDYSENLGLELFGIDADGFARSAFLSQRVMEGGVDNATITAKLNNILDADDDVGRYEAAAALLDKSRQYYKRQGGRGRIAELEDALSQMRVQEDMCLEAARQCGEYTKSVENIDAALCEIRVKRDAVAEEEQGLSEIRTKAAVTAHGRTLLSERDALLQSAAEKQRFLGTDTDMQVLDREIAAAENTEKRIAIRSETIRQTENQRKEAQKQLSALLAIDGSQTDADRETANGAYDADAEADAAVLRFHAPDDAALADIRAARDALVYARYAKEQAVGPNAPDSICTDDDGIPDSVPECLSDDELERHMKQAAVYASVCETLAQPKVYAADKDRIFSACGMAGDTVLPDETAMDAYADGLRHLQANAARRKTVSDKQREDEEALQALTGGNDPDAAEIPEEDLLVSMRTLYDGLAAEKREIDAMEEKQHTAAAERLKAHRRKRICIGTGVFLLVCTVLFFGFNSVNRDIRLLTAAGMAAVPGILILLYGIFGFGENGIRVLDDDMLKRLCEKKSEYENNKTAVYEFLDRYADGAVLDTDTAERIFRELSARCRRREELRAALENARAQIERLDGEDADTRAALLSLRQGGTQPGGVIHTDTEDEAAFAGYRETVRACRKAADDAAREAKDRADCRTRAGALRQTLDAYLAALSETPARQYLSEHETVNGDGYLARLHLWKTAADTLRSRIAAKRDAEAAYRDAQKRLETLLEPFDKWMCHVRPQAEEDPGTGSWMDGDICTCAEQLLKTAEQRKQKRQSLSERIAAFDSRIEETQKETDAERVSLQAFLKRFYGNDIPADEAAGIRSVSDTRRSLAEDMERLRRAQDALQAFCRSNDTDEASLSHAEDTAAGAKGTEARQAELSKESEILASDAERLRNARAAMLQKAESASAKAAEITAVKERIAAQTASLEASKRELWIITKTKELLDEAKNAMSTRYLAVMQKHFRSYYAQIAGISEKDAEALSLDQSLLAQMEVGGVRRESGYFSRGTADLIGLCIRLSLIDALYADGREENRGGELPPLILDDPFVNLDGQKLTAARGLLDKLAERYQIIYLVCHESRL